MDRWKSDPAIRQDFRALEVYSSFRLGVASGTVKGFDASGEKLDRPRSDRSRNSPRRFGGSRAGCDFRQPVEVRARQVWGLNPKVRAEFGDDFERYLAWRRRAERSRG